jgi:hypothetical protein
MVSLVFLSAMSPFRGSRFINPPNPRFQRGNLNSSSLNLIGPLYKGAALIIIVLGIAGCGPSIEIIHQDPTHPIVQITVDNNRTKTLDYGDDTSVSVSEGPHLVRAVPKGENQCPWTDDGEGWTIWVEKEAQLTLLPPANADNSSLQQKTNGAAEK